MLFVKDAHKDSIVVRMAVLYDLLTVAPARVPEAVEVA